MKVGPGCASEVPGILEAIKNDDNTVLLDVFEGLGVPELSSKKLHVRRNQLSKSWQQKKSLSNLSDICRKLSIDKVLFSTLDNLQTFLTFDSISEIKSWGIDIGCILGDDELNHNNFKFYVSQFDFSVIYLDNFVSYYNRYGARNIFVQGNAFSKANMLEPSSSASGVIFVGSPFPQRVKLIKRLLKLMPNLALDIFGPPKRWKPFINLKGNFKGFLLAHDFFKKVNQYRFTYSSLIDMNNKIHMNTKVWEAICSGSYPIVERHSAFEQQYGLVGELAINYAHNEDEIQRLISGPSRYEEIKKIQNHVAQNFAYDITYSKLLEAFRSLTKDQSKNEIEPYIGAVTVTCKAGSAVYPWLAIPGYNIFRFDEKGARALGFWGALIALGQRNVSRTTMNIGKIDNNSFVWEPLNYCIGRLYEIYKTKF